MIVLNGAERDDITAPLSVTALLAQLDIDGGRGVAVAVDAVVIPRSEWDALVVSNGAKVEILTAVQGG